MDLEKGNGNDSVGGDLNGDTQEFSEAELALIADGHTNGGVNCPWARLVSVDKSYSSIELTVDDVVLGRGDVKKANGEEEMRVSKAHCRIWGNAGTGVCYVENVSVNGTLVQGKPVEKGQQGTISQGEEICFGRQASGGIKFVFQILNGVKRGIEVETEPGTPFFRVDNGNGLDAKKPKMSPNFETFKCSICLYVWHDVISVTPCLHSFCNSCFSDWYRQSCRDRIACICPQCRGVVSSVSRNHTLHSLVDDLLKDDPSLGRTPEDIADLDRNSIFKAGSEAQFQFGRKRSNWMDVQPRDDASWAGDDTQNSNLASSEDEDEEDEEEERCVQCVSSQGGQFQCLPGQAHLACLFCGHLYPERSDVNDVVQKCQVCAKAYCRTYFESQHLTTVSYERCPKILVLSQRGVMDMPGRTHHGNNYEQEVTKRYIAEQGLTVDAVLRDWLGRVDSGEADQPPFSTLFQIRVSSLSAVCDFCADEVFAYLLDKFRASIPRTELPPDAAGRPDCWYGYECRTQHHKEAHSRKLNHVCEPSRQSGRRSTAVQL